MDVKKLIATRDYIADSLNAYVVYDNDYETFGQVMSYYASDLMFTLNLMIEDLSDKEINVERTEQVNE